MMAQFFASLSTRAVLISDSHNLQSTHFSLFSLSLSLYLVFSRRISALRREIELGAAAKCTRTICVRAPERANKKRRVRRECQVGGFAILCNVSNNTGRV
jgi:hypothetical protein